MWSGKFVFRKTYPGGPAPALFQLKKRPELELRGTFFKSPIEKKQANLQLRNGLACSFARPECGLRILTRPILGVLWVSLQSAIRIPQSAFKKQAHAPASRPAAPPPVPARLYVFDRQTVRLDELRCRQKNPLAALQKAGHQISGGFRQ